MFGKNELLEQLKKLNIAYKLYEHPAIFTVNESAEFEKNIKGLHCKTLFMEDKKNNFYLIPMNAYKKADLKDIKQNLNIKEWSFGKEEDMINLLGIKPGSVTPFAIINDIDKKINLIIDKDIKDADLINFHPMVNTATITFKSADLFKFFDCLEYKYSIYDIKDKS